MPLINYINSRLTLSFTLPSLLLKVITQQRKSNGSIKRRTSIAATQSNQINQPSNQCCSDSTPANEPTKLGRSMCILIRYRHSRCGHYAKNPDASNREKYDQQYETCDWLLDLQDRYRDQYYENIVPTAPCGFSLEKLRRKPTMNTVTLA